MRKVFIVILLFVAIAMLLVPPWKMRVNRILGSYGHQYHYTFAGYLPFWMEPQLYSDGSTANDLNHYTEVEVYGLLVEVNVVNRRRSLVELAEMYVDWQTVSAPGTLSFHIPPTLEVQMGVIKQLGTEMREQLFEDIIESEQSSDRIVAQPKGINDRICLAGQSAFLASKRPVDRTKKAKETSNVSRNPRSWHQKPRFRR